MARVSLDVIQVREPCSESWAKMVGDDRARFCDVCQANVFDLSSMREDEIAELLEGRGESLCVRLVRRADGTLVTKDCAPDRLARARRAAKRSLGLAAVAVAGLLAWTAGVAGIAGLTTYLLAEDEPEPCELPMMGAIAPMPPSEPVETEPSVEPSDEDDVGGEHE